MASNQVFGVGGRGELLPMYSERVAVLADPLASDYFSDDTADIYTNFYCEGAGEDTDPRLCDYCSCPLVSSKIAV
jgi:hypothetical protein